MTFKSTSIAFFISVCILSLFFYFYHINYGWLMLPVVIYVSLIIYGSANIQSNFFIEAFCSAYTSQKEIAITFDDGPNAEFTPGILSVLAEYNVKATFFVIGRNVEGNENLIKRIDSEGHAIGNHTYSHSFLIDFKNKTAFMDELSRTSDLIYSTIEKRMKLFRPPYGVTTPDLAKASKELNYQIIGWNVRSLDTTNDKEELISKRVAEQLKPGAIVLFHDTSEKTIQILRKTLEFAKQNGFKIVRLDALLGTDNEKIQIYES